MEKIWKMRFIHSLPDSRPQLCLTRIWKSYGKWGLYNHYQSLVQNGVYTIITRVSSKMGFIQSLPDSRPQLCLTRIWKSYGKWGLYNHYQSLVQNGVCTIFTRVSSKMGFTQSLPVSRPKPRLWTTMTDTKYTRHKSKYRL